MVKFINKVNVALDEVEDEREHGIWVPNPHPNSNPEKPSIGNTATTSSSSQVSVSVQSAEKRWENYRADVLTSIDFVVNSNCNRTLKALSVSMHVYKWVVQLFVHVVVSILLSLVGLCETESL